jgi:hypothetical protein
MANKILERATRLVFRVMLRDNAEWEYSKCDKSWGNLQKGGHRDL